MLPISEFKIGYKTYNFVYLNEEDAEKEIDGDFGQADHDESVIKFNEKLAKEDPVEFANTVLHEIGHCIYHVYHITDRDNEEDTIRPYTNALCELWQNYPKLFDWFSSTLAKNKV